MKLIVGLGNPGFKYKKTRHNIGFMVIDQLKIDNAILLKPTTYMNNSGKAVKAVMDKNEISDLMVIHDDIDLPFGTIRTNKDSSSAGHKGVQSIINELKTKDFTRIRIGINPGKKVNTERFVLEKFSKDEKKQLKEVIRDAIGEIKNSCS